MRRKPGKMEAALGALGQDFAVDFTTGDVTAVDAVSPSDSLVTDIFGTTINSPQPAIDAGAFTPPPTLDEHGLISLGIDLNKAVAYGGAVYKYIRQSSGGKTTYVPQRVATSAPRTGISNLPGWVIPAGLAALAYFLVFRR